MEILKAEQLAEAIATLDNEQRLFISVSEDVSKKMQLIFLKHRAYESLFRTCLVDNPDVSNEFNLNQFLQEYAAAYMEMNDLINTTMLQYVGRDNFELINKLGIRYDINWGIDKIIIYRGTQGCCV
jgi:hypothetical protein